LENDFGDDVEWENRERHFGTMKVGGLKEVVGRQRRLVRERREEEDEWGRRRGLRVETRRSCGCWSAMLPGY
jgi:hypothetical protein